MPLAHGEGTQLRLKRYELGELNVRLMDVGLSNINQCRESDGTCELPRTRLKQNTERTLIVFYLTFSPGDRMRAELKVAERVNPFNAMKYKVRSHSETFNWCRGSTPDMPNLPSSTPSTSTGTAVSACGCCTAC